MNKEASVRGAFQPPTTDEIERLRHMIDTYGTVTIILESWKASRNLRTPFTAEERESLIRSALDAQAKKTRFIYEVDDFYRNRSAEVQSHEIGTAITWSDSSDVRDHYLRSGSMTGVPTENRKWLEDFLETDEYKKLRADRLAIDEYKDSWSSAPYPPIFVTTDALVTKSDRVLMIRRGHPPGTGQTALPGGFLESDECLLTGVLRELEEETGFRVEGVNLRDRLSAIKVFDEPKRSARGRTITHVHHFALRESDPEPVFKAGDDAAEVFWMKISDIEEFEVFEDHYQILRAFL